MCCCMWCFFLSQEGLVHDRFGPQQNVVSKLNVLFWSKVSGLLSASFSTACSITGFNLTTAAVQTQRRPFPLSSPPSLFSPLLPLLPSPSLSSPTPSSPTPSFPTPSPPLLPLLLYSFLPYFLSSPTPSPIPCPPLLPLPSKPLPEESAHLILEIPEKDKLDLRHWTYLSTM